MCKENTKKLYSEDTTDENDTFYNTANIKHLKKAIVDMEENKGQIHELIEE